MSARDHIDKAGLLGSVLASLCCLGVSAVVSIVTALGLGFLLNDAVLLPLLVASLLVTLWGLFSCTASASCRSAHGWLWIGGVLAVGAPLLTVLPERIWGQYSSRSKDRCW